MASQTSEDEIVGHRSTRWFLSAFSLGSSQLARSASSEAKSARAEHLSGFGRIAIVAVQLGLLLLTFYVFDLERDGFVKLAPLIFGGFIVHALLPMHFRMPFFLALSLAAFFVMWQWPALVFVGIGLGLIGICHLPINLWARVALLVAAGCALAVLRTGMGPLGASIWISTIMPVVGSVFMFRLMIYLYDIQHEREPATIWERLSYFFLLPNACFLLFPVVDYQTFRRTYYDTDGPTIYQKGVFWMFRGLTHLLLYRILYYYVVPNPTQVVDLWTLALIVFGTYLLYLKVSGLFHLIVGTLGLFGFNLPETYHRFLLASGFNDFWRHSNIYFKDFMMKLVYYPAFMRLRKGKGGMALAVGLATAVVFLVTWMLHSYQWFWLLGAFPLTVTDMVFWSIFGSLVVVNSVSQLKSGKKGSLGKPVFSFRKALVRAVKVMGMIIFIAVLWSFWYSPTPGAWLSMLGEAGNSGPGDFGLLVLMFAALIATGVGVQYASSLGARFTLLDPAKPVFSRAAMVTSLGILAVLVLGQPQARGLLGSDLGGFVASLQEDRLTEFDAQQADRGYYDALMTSNSIATQTGGGLGSSPPDWKSLRQSGLVDQTDDMFIYRLRPSIVLSFKRTPTAINQWGMRDREYERAKPEGTYRIALLGGSIEMGAGVQDSEVFEAVAETRLNRDFAGRDTTFARYEILNFGVGGYSALQHLPRLEEAIPFAPDLVVYTGHTVEDYRMLSLLVELVQEEVEMPAHLAFIVARAGAQPSMSEAELHQRLDPLAAEILREQYARIAARCREVGALPVWIYVPRTTEGSSPLDEDVAEYGSEVSIEIQKAMASEAGFFVLDISDAYDNVEDVAEELFVAPWDDHPSVYGHLLLGNRFYDVLIENRATFGLIRQANEADLARPSSVN